jgi:pyruvate carboxylase subunit B
VAGTYTVTIKERTYKIVPVSDDQVEVDGICHTIDFVPLDSRSFSLILDGTTYSIDRIQPHTREGDNSNGDGELGHTVCLSVRGKHFVARVDDDHSLLVRSLFSKPPTASGIQVIRAPMPGLISRIEVRIGEEVALGKGLLVLEAMKMENEIRSTNHGRVQAIHVEKGKPVEKGEALVTIEWL